MVHGGLSTQEDVTLAQIEAIPRNREPPQTGLMSDLLWAGPLQRYLSIAELPSIDATNRLLIECTNFPSVP